MKNLLTLLTLSVILVFSPGTSNATVYYISTTGSDSNPGTIDQPFKTFNRMATLNLQPGDIVYIRAGTYLSGRTGGGNGFNISNKAGTQANPITIAAYPADFPNGGRVTLDCRDYLGTASFFGANITNCPWFIFRGIKIIGVPQRDPNQINVGWLMNNSSNTVIDNCEAAYCGYSGFALGNSNNVTYKNCDSHNNDNALNTGVQHHGGSDGFARTSADNTSTNTHYIGCRSWFNADDGWDCFDTNGTIYYENCWAFWNGYRGDVFPLSHCNGSDCWGDGNGFKMGGSNTNVTGSTTRFITNCLAFQNYMNGFDQNAGHFVGQAYNNTAYGNGGVGMCLAYYSGLAMVIRNNISYQNKYDIPQTTYTNSWIQSNNTWNGTPASNSSIASLTNTGVDGARQADGSLPNLTFLHLASGSNLIDKGMNVGLPFSGSAPDMGAFEYGGQSSPDQPPVANAGSDQTFFLPATSTTLGGSGTDPDGTITGYQWTKISGPSQCTITSPTLAKTNVSNLTQGQYQFELKVTDNAGATDKDTMSVTVEASSNQAPVAKAGNSQTITLPTNSVSVDGSSSNDPDGTIASYQWTKILGPSSAGITNATSAATTITSLVQGVYQFELKVTDNSGAIGRDTVQITVGAAANQSPSANAGGDINLTLPTNSTTLAGSGSDPDGTIASYQWTKVSGPSQYTISSPTQSSTPISNLVQGTYQFQLTVKDNSGATDFDIVQVTVDAAPNQAPTADAGLDINLTLPTNSTTLSGSGNDPDGTINSYQWSKISGPAQYTMSSPGQRRTDVSNLAEGIYEFQLQVTDNSGAVATDIVRVTVNGSTPQPNQNPNASAGSDLSITLPTDNATLSGSGTDPDGNIASYQWTMISGPSQYDIVSATQATTSVDNLAEGVYEFQLQVTDDKGATDVDVVQVTVNAAPKPNQSPTADAGADINITLPTNAISLSGAGTDPDGTIASYRWAKIAGPSQYSIVWTTLAKTSVNNLVQGSYSFELTVTDNSGATAKDTIEVTVNAAVAKPNQIPEADAGSDITITLPTNSTRLSGDGTDPDGRISSYRWRSVSGPKQFTINSPNRSSTTMGNLVQGVYDFELTVTDNEGATGKDTVAVTVLAAPVNQAPKANAGPDKTLTLPNNSTSLSGSGSDPDGTITSYKWRKVSGPSQYNFSSSSRAQASLNNLTQGVYQVELTVTDNKGKDGKDTVQVTVNPAAAAPNQAPTANAGLDINVTLPTNSVILSGSGTDPDGTIASYRWTKIAGPSDFAIVSSTDPRTTVNNLIDGTYKFELTVTDNLGKSAKDTVQVIVNPATLSANHSPTADAGTNLDITLPTNTVKLTGHGKDQDGTITSYKWKKSGGPTQYNIVSSNTAETEVTNLVEGVYQFELTVTDNSNAAGRSTMQVTVHAAPNEGPVADAGSDVQISLPTDTATLTGAASTDPDGTIASYRWTRISGPGQSTVVSPSKSQTLIDNLTEGIHEFELTVTDNAGATSKDTVEIIVLAVPKAFAKVFPNPATTTVNFQIEGAGRTSHTALRIYDNKGILVYQEDFVRPAQPMIKQVNVSKLPAGIYFAELQTDTNDITTLRFMKK